MKKITIPDTNIFLHYDILSVDWCKEVGVDTVEILVCPTVLKELDEKKYDANKILVERATRNLSIIESHNASKDEIRKNVKISVIVKEPKVEWEKYGLDSSVKDDRILGFIKERNNQDDVLITNDSTPRLKGKEIGISVIKLSCEMLPNPKDEQNKEMEKMQKEIQTLKNKIPELGIKLISEETTEKNLPKYTIKTIHELSKEEIDNIVSEREQELNIEFRVNPFGISIMGVDRIGYKSDVEKYLKLYRDFIIAKNPVDKELSTILKMEFQVHCEKAPAEDIYCEIELPKDFQILEEEEIPRLPSEPSKPEPMTLLQRSVFGNFSGLMPLRDIMLHNLIKPTTESNTNFIINSNIIKGKIKKINHEFQVTLCTVYVKLPSMDFAKSFEISYYIHASNLPESIKKKIPVIIEKID
jgi:hypothetical protein